MNAQKEKPSYSVMDNLKFTLKHTWEWDKSVIILCVLNSIVIAIAPFIWMFAPKLLIDELLGSKRINNILMILIITFILGAVINYLKPYLAGVYRMKMNGVRYKFIDLIHEKAMGMDFKHTEEPKVLDSIWQALETVLSPRHGIGGILDKLFTIMGYLISFAGYMSIVLTLNPLILLYLVVNVVIVYLLSMKINKFEKDKEITRNKVRRQGFYINDTMTDFKYGKDIRIYDMKNILQNKKKSFDIEKVNILREIEKKRFKLLTVDSMLFLLREGIVYSYLVFEVLNKNLTIGNFTLYSVTISGFADCMQNLIKDFAQVKADCLYVGDFRKFLNIKDDEKAAKLKDIPKEKPYCIELKNISFKYPNSERFIFENLSLKINPGKKLAIVGINGAGKTTLVKLISRLYKPTSGEILLNGVNIWELDGKEYFKKLSIVFQNINIYAFTVAENIALNSHDINEKLIYEAAEKAGIKSKIDSLEDGIKTNMLKVIDDNGVEFSGGENQKLAIARALYKNGDIIILDEPTAALDPISEENIYKSLNALIGNKTAIYISHRLSSTRFCDEIAFFEDGKIKEYGTHEELLAKGEGYANMFNVQAQYYKEETEKEA